MSSVFPAPILALPEADVPVKGAKAYLSQGAGHQVIYMHFSEDVDLAEHSHAAQWGIIIDGKVDLDIGGVLRTYEQGRQLLRPRWRETPRPHLRGPEGRRILRPGRPVQA